MSYLFPRIELATTDQENMVTMRQPYLGIITYFLWSLLLMRIELLWIADKRCLPVSDTLKS